MLFNSPAPGWNNAPGEYINTRSTRTQNNKLSKGSKWFTGADDIEFFSMQCTVLWVMDLFVWLESSLLFASMHWARRWKAQYPNWIYLLFCSSESKANFMQIKSCHWERDVQQNLLFLECSDDKSILDGNLLFLDRCRLGCRINLCGT